MIKIIRKLEVSLIMLICVFLLSSCEEKKESDVLEPQYALGTSIDIILENEGEPSKVVEHENGTAYTYSIEDELLYGLECSRGVIIYFVNNDELLFADESHYYTSDEEKGREVYNELLQIINDSNYINKNDVLYETEDGKIEVIIAETGTGVMVRHISTELNEDKSFK